jgi:hypothetical protein
MYLLNGMTTGHCRVALEHEFMQVQVGTFELHKKYMLTPQKLPEFSSFEAFWKNKTAFRGYLLKLEKKILKHIENRLNTTWDTALNTETLSNQISGLSKFQMVDCPKILLIKRHLTCVRLVAAICQQSISLGKHICITGDFPHTCNLSNLLFPRSNHICQ